MARIYDGYSIKGPNKSREITVVPTKILKERFIAAYETTCSVQAACRILGIVPRTVYHWKKNDEEFAREIFIAEQVALQNLEDEAVRRAVHGVEKPVYQQGKLVGYVMEYSDALLTLLLKARAPHKYKERFSGELTGADGKPLLEGVTINHVHSSIPLATSEDDIAGEVQDSIKERQQRITNNTEDIPFDEPSQPDTDELNEL